MGTEKKKEVKEKDNKPKEKTAGKSKSGAAESKPANRKYVGERDEKGRFVKGNSGNPNGRPKVPDEIKKYGREAPAKLREIADDPTTPVRIKYEIERWFAEMAFGKAVQQQIIDAKVDQKPVIFMGDDEIAE